MKHIFQAALVAAGLVAFMGQAGAEELRLPSSLTSFGAAQDSPALSAASLPDAALQGPSSRVSRNIFAADPIVLKTGFGTVSMPHDFAASTALSERLAVDTGYGVDLTQRFGNYDGLQSPLLNDSDFLGLASGGHYLGATYMPAQGLHVRLGASQWGERRDGRALATAATGLPLAFDRGLSQSLLAGVSWDVSDWADFGVAALHNEQRELGGISSLIPGSKETTQALEMTAHLKFGNGWVTTASFGQGLSQLDLRSQESALDTRSYSLAIAKHGLFGDDALGVSFTRPALGMIDNGFSAVTASGDLPPLFIANDRFPNHRQETDLQLGYVTSFLDGALALQANAAYQMNYQGQTGATSVSLLSRAKIKF
jgi:hypothetical protein